MCKMHHSKAVQTQLVIRFQFVRFIVIKIVISCASGSLAGSPQPPGIDCMRCEPASSGPGIRQRPHWLLAGADAVKYRKSGLTSVRELLVSICDPTTDWGWAFPFSI